MRTPSWLAVTVCHLPPGTSKWNRIEHCLFSHISMNWRGRPLVSHEVVVQLIGTTTTRTGLKAWGRTRPGLLPTGIKVTDAELAAMPLTRHAFHGGGILGGDNRSTDARRLPARDGGWQ